MVNVNPLIFIHLYAFCHLYLFTNQIIQYNSTNVKCIFTFFASFFYFLLLKNTTNIIFAILYRRVYFGHYMCLSLIHLINYCYHATEIFDVTVNRQVISKSKQASCFSKIDIYMTNLIY